MSGLPGQHTWRGRRLAWLAQPLRARTPLEAWQGVLHNRGLQEDDAFFSPRLSDLPDPDGMMDMPEAAERIVRAVRARERIHVFGDFDADGVIGTAILVDALRRVGVDMGFSIPCRMEEGHGIGLDQVEQAVASGASLGISVDTGTHCMKACQRAAELGMDMIVSDHHLPGETLPGALAVLNPARADCGFAQRKLCGTGVAFFLLMGVYKRLRAEKRELPDLRQLLDRVAVATVADVMELVGVNRVLVHHGLMQLRERPSPGLAALMKVASIRRPPDVETIAFQLAPRINAAGRMQHGIDAMRLLSCRDAEEAAKLALSLDQANVQRRKVEAEVYRQAEERVQVEGRLALYDAGWHAGVIGLVAGRLARRHGRPAAVGFLTRDGHIRISLRAAPGFHVGDILKACKSCLLSCGGHQGAGGGVLRENDWQDFVVAFEEAVSNQQHCAKEQAVLYIDGELGMEAMHPGLALRLERLAPHGHGNPACRWLLRDVRVWERREMRGGAVRLQLGDGRRTVEAVAFRHRGLNQYLQPGARLSVIGQLQLDRWRGNGAVQWLVEDGLSEA
ncbi:MAG: single-stranded-DNA-specific exonuclease RecJ [Zetaproteobacteria bacterium]|nr:MAG: single-stranded-DNA-specific exonuclease RecJ [Zetaproteobacteria bacterium]